MTRRIIVLTIILFIMMLIFQSIALAWENKTTHRNITNQALNYLSDNNVMPLNVINKYRNTIINGAVEEDIPVTRAWFHFDEPLDSLSSGSSYQWAFVDGEYKGFCPFGNFDLDIIFGEGTYVHSWTLKNDYNWLNAIKAENLGNYKGWFALGHVAHLLQDLAIPAHVRKDPHAKPFDGDPLEIYGNYRMPPLPTEGLGELENKTPEELFIWLKEYTRNNFFSNDTVCFDNDKPGPKRSPIEEPNYYLDINGRKISRKWPFRGIDETIVAEQFLELSKKAILCTAALINYYYNLNPEPSPEPYPGEGSTKWPPFASVNQNSSPAIGFDNTIYVGSSYKLYALNPDGTLKWPNPFSTPGGSANSPTIGPDGTIYIGTDNGRLYAVNPSGIKKWPNPISIGGGSAIYGSPALGADGTIYVAAGWFVYAINPDGSQKWAYRPGPAGITIYTSPVVGADGNVYLVDYCGPGSYSCVWKLLAISPTGNQKGQVITNENQLISASPAIGSDGTIYTGGRYSGNNGLFAIHPYDPIKWNSQGTPIIGIQIKWHYPTIEEIQTSPVIGPDGTIYVGTSSGVVYAINPDGTLRWKSNFAIQGQIVSSPALGADGVIYVKSSAGFIYAINPDGNYRWTSPIDAGSYSSPAIGTDGTLFTSSGSKLFAINTYSGGLAPSSWPMFHRDPKHTGRLQ